MKHRSTAFSVPRMVVRLKDPQMQVWIMAGVAVLLVLIGHLRAWSPSGEGKNASTASASKMLLGGARMEWTEEFGPGKLVTQRPALILETPSIPSHTASARRTAQRHAPSALAVNLNVRPIMQEAAEKTWKFLKSPLRQQLSALPIPAAAPTVRLRWSGDARGNATLVARSRKPGPNGTALLASFVIGNGSRSPDGLIEILPVLPISSGSLLITTSTPALPPPPCLEITLIGTAATGASPRQTAALGELLNQLEAVCGHRLAMEGEAPSPPSEAPGPPIQRPAPDPLQAPDLAHSSRPSSPSFPAASPPTPAPSKPGTPTAFGI